MRFVTPLRALAVSTLALAIGASAGIVIATTPAEVVATATDPAVHEASAELLSDAHARSEAEISRAAAREALDAEMLASVEARNATLTATAEAISETDAAIAQRLAEEKAAREKAEAEAKAAAEKAEAEALKGGTPAQNKELARKLARDLYGWGEDQFSCYDNIIMRESLWITTADNPTSSAYGIPQALPGKKMASEGADWKTNPATQIKWGLKYVKERFGTPCGAWSFKKAHGWY
ncbi:MAG: hypothetical protein QM708_07485 [Propioniciclava sp.]|uniref:aggregation-promoting factor C-terminal-like domain-containing protein n=1 Tax=Propioniciclava sp. TaxID=2038686 RepID=UPI0039E240E0